MVLGFARRLARWPGTVSLVLTVGTSAALLWAKGTVLPDPSTEMQAWERDSLHYYRTVIEAEHDLRKQAAANSTLAFDIGSDHEGYYHWLTDVLDRADLQVYDSRPRTNDEAIRVVIRAIREGVEASRIQDIRVHTDIIRLLGSMKQHAPVLEADHDSFSPTDRLWTPVKATPYHMTGLSLVEIPYMTSRLSATIYWLKVTHVRQSARLWRQSRDMILAECEDMGLWPNSWSSYLAGTVKRGTSALFPTENAQTGEPCRPVETDQAAAVPFTTQEKQTGEQIRAGRRVDKEHAREEIGQFLMAGPWV